MENKIKLNKGLVVKKTTIAKLQESQMAQIKGGLANASLSCLQASCIYSCKDHSCNAAVGAL